MAPLLLNKNREVARGAQAEIAVQGLRGIKVTGRHADAVEGTRDFFRDVGVLADPGADYFATMRHGGLHGADHIHEVLVEAPGRGGEGFPLDGEAETGLGEQGGGVQWHQKLVLEERRGQT